MAIEDPDAGWRLALWSHRGRQTFARRAERRKYLEYQGALAIGEGDGRSQVYRRGESRQTSGI